MKFGIEDLRVLSSSNCEFR